MMFHFELGYLGLFLSAFLAATILPVASEVFLVAMLKYGFEPSLCLLIATIGNSLGAIFNYYIGFLGDPNWLKKLRVSIDQINRWKDSFQRYGVWLALFSWLPIIGDVLGVALGFFKAPKLPTFIFFTIGKFLRYLLVIFFYFL